MTQHTTAPVATRRAVWFTIVTATEYPTGLPDPVVVMLLERAERPIAAMTLASADDAQLWARWCDADHHAQWSLDGSVTFFAERSGWAWQLAAPGAIVEAIVQPEAASPLNDRADLFESKIWACPEGCGYHIADGPPHYDGDEPTDELIRQHMEEHSTVDDRSDDRSPGRQPDSSPTDTSPAAIATDDRRPVAGDTYNGFAIEAFDDAETTGDYRVVVRQGAAVLRQFAYPKYRIWTLLAHWREDELVNPGVPR